MKDQKLLLTAKMDIKQIDIDATMMEGNREQMLLADATMMDVNRKQMLLLR